MLFIAYDKSSMPTKKENLTLEEVRRKNAERQRRYYNSNIDAERKRKRTAYRKGVRLSDNK